jgi:hypothetical protein
MTVPFQGEDAPRCLGVPGTPAHVPPRKNEWVYGDERESILFSLDSICVFSSLFLLYGLPVPSTAAQVNIWRWGGRLRLASPVPQAPSWTSRPTPRGRVAPVAVRCTSLSRVRPSAWRPCAIDTTPGRKPTRSACFATST